MFIVTPKITPVHIATTGTAVVGALAFAMSFSSLSALAAANSVPAGQAWMLPVIVDGLSLVATVMTVALKKHRAYAWFLLTLGTIVSLAGNTLHAGMVSHHNPIAIGIAAIPPMFLLFVTHGTVLLSKQAARGRAGRRAAATRQAKRDNANVTQLKPAATAR